MAGVFDEEIVRSYFELRGCFVRTNVAYRASAARDDSSDVDVVAVDPIRRVGTASEVKGWRTQPSESLTGRRIPATAAHSIG